MAPDAYTAIPAEEESEYSESITANEKLRKQHRPSSWTWQRLGPVAWLFTTFLLGILIIVALTALTKQPSDKQCAEKLAVWSPAFEALEIVDVQFQNKFMEKSIYRGKPTPELEDAWHNLWSFGGVNVPYDKLDVLNKSRDVDWKRTRPESGGGVLGSLEVFHHIHCLDLVRQYTYRDEYDYSKNPSFDGTPEQIRGHVDHCINSLRLFLQCKVDLVPYLVKVNTNTPLGVQVDFNTRHKCVNFEKIRDWARDNELHTSDYENEIHVDHDHA